MIRYHRKIITIDAECSPNVRLARAQIASGKKPTDEILVPGLLTWGELCHREATWDEKRKCIGLKAKFWKGAEDWLYPLEWRLLSIAYARELVGKVRRALGMGIDPGEGEANTTWTIVDRLGVIYQESKKTPNTSMITGYTIALMRQFNVPAPSVCFDRGGGGKQHADRLESQGYKVRTVGFGEGISLDPKRGMTMIETRMDAKEERYAYKNRRAEMAMDLRGLMEPVSVGGVMVSRFGIPEGYTEMHRQLGLMPKWEDEEGRIFLPKKQRRSDERDTETEKSKPTMEQIIGHSPDEFDSLMLACHAMVHVKKPSVAGAGR